MEKSYRTKQRTAILDFLKNNVEEHITADKIIEHFKANGNPIGKSTVYRYLDNLVEENIVRKYAASERGDSACYQYINGSKDCCHHFHMKCSKCGALIHLDCHEIEELTEHIYKEHKFKLDICKTILYGTCERCAIDEKMKGL